MCMLYIHPLIMSQARQTKVWSLVKMLFQPMITKPGLGSGVRRTRRWGAVAGLKLIMAISLLLRAKWTVYHSHLWADTMKISKKLLIKEIIRTKQRYNRALPSNLTKLTMLTLLSLHLTTKYKSLAVLRWSIHGVNQKSLENQSKIRGRHRGNKMILFQRQKRAD